MPSQLTFACAEAGCSGLEIGSTQGGRTCCLMLSCTSACETFWHTDWSHGVECSSVAGNLVDMLVRHRPCARSAMARGACSGAPCWSTSQRRCWPSSRRPCSTLPALQLQQRCQARSLTPRRGRRPARSRVVSFSLDMRCP